MARRKHSDRIDAELGLLYGKPLTEREGDTVRAVLAGHTTRQTIGAAMTVTYRTANAHLWRIYAKTGAHNMADLVLMAVGRKPCDVDLSEFRHENGD
jgi:DNA-binding CsgD family transcriptional regulator